MVKKDVYKRVNGYKHIYFYGNEDLDFYLRVYSLGFRIGVNLDTTVYHVGGATVKTVMGRGIIGNAKKRASLSTHILLRYY